MQFQTIKKVKSLLDSRATLSIHQGQSHATYSEEDSATFWRFLELSNQTLIASSRSLLSFGEHSQIIRVKNNIIERFFIEALIPEVLFEGRLNFMTNIKVERVYFSL